MTTRKVDPGVGKARSLLCNGVKSGLPDDVIAEYRQQLHEAKIVAAAKKVAAQMQDLPFDSPVRDQVRAIFR